MSEPQSEHEDLIPEEPLSDDAKNDRIEANVRKAAQMKTEREKEKPASGG